MSKKKNTLQDLDDFLKQQAATLVTPGTLSDIVEPTPEIKAAEVQPIAHDVGKTSLKNFKFPLRNMTQPSERNFMTLLSSH